MRQDFAAADFETLPYLTAVVKVCELLSSRNVRLCLMFLTKETLRFHPIAFNLSRIAGGNNVLPLLYPITTQTGEVLTELPIPKGLHITTSIAAYNR